MSVQKLDTWAARFVQTFSLSALEGAVIGVDADYYLQQCLNENQEEPLKSALGGTPFCLHARIEDDIQAAKDAGFGFLFVFNGLDYVNRPTPTSQSAESRRAHEDGWAHYSAGDASSPVKDFGRAKYPQDLLYRLLREILYDNKVPYLVAPFSSIAQLAYLYNIDDGRPIDAIMASCDAFLFEVDKVILAVDAKDASFNSLRKSDCEEQLGKPSAQVFREAQLLLGSSFLPTFPGLERPPASANPSIKDALTLLNRAGGSVLQLCHQYRDDTAVQQLDYSDRLKKALMTIKHHIIIAADGSLVPLDFQHAPGDVHAFVGQKLPEELFFYISRGLLGPQIPNWLTSGEIKLTLPGGVTDSELYRRFVIEQLNPLRLQSLKLLAESLHFYYQGRDLVWSTWDGRDTKSMNMKVKDIQPLKEKASQWKVQERMFPASLFKSGRTVTMLACLRAVKDTTFAQDSITTTKVEHPALKTKPEITANIFWRFLHIRGYIDDKHQLTKWGLMLEAALARYDGAADKEELAVMAIELLRLGGLNTSPLAGVANGAQTESSKHVTNTRLIAKIACLGRLRHDSVGYVGPLDRELLSFAWMISSLRASLRDLIEVIMVAMFLNGDALREREDWFKLSHRLPFTTDNGATLGIATKTYLDALDDVEVTDELKSKVKNQEDRYNWFTRIRGATLHKNLENAFKLFDTVYAAAQLNSKDFKNISDAHEWLESRR